MGEPSFKKSKAAARTKRAGSHDATPALFASSFGNVLQTNLAGAVSSLNLLADVGR